jgi:hypothetical protein
MVTQSFLTARGWPVTASQRAIRGVRQESEILLRQLESYLVTVRTGVRHVDLPHAERMAAALRQLIADTTHASAVDRARVRAAVHYFVSRGAASGIAARARVGAGRYALLPAARPERRMPRLVADDDRVVNDLFRELGRADLVVTD